MGVLVCVFRIMCACVLEREREREEISYWVEARVFPSGPKAAAMVDLGGGSNGQYLAPKCCNDSASTLDQTKPNISIKRIIPE